MNVLQNPVPNDQTIRSRFSNLTWQLGPSAFISNNIPYAVSNSLFLAKAFFDCFKHVQKALNKKELQIFELASGLGQLSDLIYSHIYSHNQLEKHKMTYHVTDNAQMLVDSLSNTTKHTTKSDHLKFDKINAISPTYAQTPDISFLLYGFDSFPTRTIYVKNGKCFEQLRRTVLNTHSPILDGTRLPHQLLSSKELIALSKRKRCHPALPSFSQHLHEELINCPIENSTFSQHEQNEIKNIVAFKQQKQQTLHTFTINYSAAIEKCIVNNVNALSDQGQFLCFDMISNQKRNVARYHAAQFFTVDLDYLYYIANKHQLQISHLNNTDNSHAWISFSKNKTGVLSQDCLSVLNNATDFTKLNTSLKMIENSRVKELDRVLKENTNQLHPLQLKDYLYLQTVGDTLFEHQRFQEAKAYFVTCLESYPKLGYKPLLSLSKIATEEGDLDCANEYLKKIIKDYPLSADPYQELAMINKDNPRLQFKYLSHFFKNIGSNANLTDLSQLMDFYHDQKEKKKGTSLFKQILLWSREYPRHFQEGALKEFLNRFMMYHPNLTLIQGPTAFPDSIRHELSKQSWRFGKSTFIENQIPLGKTNSSIYAKLLSDLFYDMSQLQKKKKYHVYELSSGTGQLSKLVYDALSQKRFSSKNITFHCTEYLPSLAKALQKNIDPNNEFKNFTCEVLDILKPKFKVRPDFAFINYGFDALATLNFKVKGTKIYEIQRKTYIDNTLPIIDGSKVPLRTAAAKDLPKLIKNGAYDALMSLSEHLVEKEVLVPLDQTDYTAVLKQKIRSFCQYKQAKDPSLKNFIFNYSPEVEKTTLKIIDNLAPKGIFLCYELLLQDHYEHHYGSTTAVSLDEDFFPYLAKIHQFNCRYVKSKLGNNATFLLSHQKNKLTQAPLLKRIEKDYDKDDMYTRLVEFEQATQGEFTRLMDTVYQRFTPHQKNYPLLLIIIGRQYFEFGENALSKKYLKKSLALYPQLDYEPLLNLIFIAYKEKDKINLLAYAKQLIHEYPYIAKNYLLLYSLYPDSRPAIDRIHLLNNYFKYVGHRYNPETLAELATLYLLIGDHKKAKEINTFLKTCTHSDT